MSETLIGAPVPRVDGPAKVTGAARYAAEFSPPGVLHAVMVESPSGPGRIAVLDASAARAAPGVVAVLTHRDAECLREPPGAADAMVLERTMPLQGDRVFYAGQKVAVVVADTLQRAEHAAGLMRVRVEGPRPALALDDEAGERSRPAERNGVPIQFDIGGVDEAIAAAAVRIERAYSTPVENHHPMEPSATVAEWDGGTLTLHDSTQGVVFTRNGIAALFGLPRERVRVVCPFVGGGFGAKGPLWAQTVLAAMAARATGRPVKLALTRQQMATTTGHRSETRQTVALGADRDGTLRAVRHATVAHTSRAGLYVEQAGRPTTVLYAAPAIAATHEVVALDVPTPSFMRAPGEAPGTFALESAMDELAADLGLDPVELRLRNQPPAHPVSGKPWTQRDTASCLRRGAERFGWARRDPAPGGMVEGRELVGWGAACAMFPGNRRPAAARARLEPDGHVVVECATQDIGTGAYTIFTQVAAEALGLPLARVRFALGDSAFPPAPASGGSMTTASAGPAVSAACAALRGEVARLMAADPASPLRGADAAEVEARDGRLFPRGDPARTETYAAFAARRGRPVEAEGRAAPGGERESHASDSTGAHFCEVRVDRRTGRLRVARWVAVFDVGRVLNARTAHGQFLGGIVYGLGMALMEETRYDRRTGRVATEGLADYHVPVNADVPAGIDVSWLDVPDTVFNPLGARGIGEIGTTGVAAAVANAVFHATGRRVRDLPITPDKLLDAAP